MIAAVPIKNLCYDWQKYLLNITVIAMVKNSSRIHYTYKGSRLSSKQIYKQNKKRRSRSRYLESEVFNLIHYFDRLKY